MPHAPDEGIPILTNSGECIPQRHTMSAMEILIAFKTHLFLLLSSWSILICTVATSVAPTQTATAANVTATTSDSIPCWPGCVCRDDGSRTCTGPQPSDQGTRVECIDYPMARDCGYPEGREDGRCGLTEFEKATCDPQGPFGGCCSSHGWCGNTTDHCGAGCLNGCLKTR